MFKIISFKNKSKDDWISTQNLINKVMQVKRLEGESVEFSSKEDEIINFKFPEIQTHKNRLNNRSKNDDGDEDSTLYVILPYYNFAKAKSRTRLFLEFVDRYKNLTSIKILIVEATTVNEEFQLPTQIKDDVYMHLKYKLESPFWCKENLINIAVSKLYHSNENWQYVAWIDAEIKFLNKNWVNDTINELKRSHFVQLFEHVVRLGPNNEISEIFDSKGFISQINNHKCKFGLAGYAWACTRWALEKTKGLLDINIVGGADGFTAFSLLNNVENWISDFLRFKTNDLNTDNYANLLSKKQKLFEVNNLKFGYIKGIITHDWHGRFKDRNYSNRKRILRDFDPQVDLIRNSEGILNFSERGKRMENELTKYFFDRNEDNLSL
jgi:hypothetical protein